MSSLMGRKPSIRSSSFDTHRICNLVLVMKKVDTISVIQWEHEKLGCEDNYVYAIGPCYVRNQVPPVHVERVVINKRPNNKLHVDASVAWNSKS